MRIGAKLLLTYLVLIGLVAILTGVALPRYVRNVVVAEETKRLDELVTWQAEYMSNRINQSIKTRNPADFNAARQLLTSVEDLLVDDTIAFVDEKCLIVRASKPQYQGFRIPDCIPSDPKARRRPEVELPGTTTAIYARAPLNVAGPLLQGYSLVMFRKMAFVDQMSKPITRRLSFVLVVALLVSLLIAGWFSRELVRRLRTAGTAARALAEGHLEQRVPEQGNDEITELARHFNHMAERIQVLVSGLRRSEQARKELLVTVSHELRTPMTSISGFAEALRDGVVKDEERRQRYYQIIAAESTRLTRLINDLFDVSKLETGQLELRLQAMPAAPWLLEFVEAQKPVAEEAGLRLVLDLSPDAERSRIYGDRDRLDQVLNNLISNAMRFAPPESRITLSARTDGEELVIELADQGPGLTREEAGRVFDRFFQGKNTGQGHKGAGLGLAIVKSLVEAHGGSVGVNSTPGAGAAFWIRLKGLV
ncbi:MAG TPA: HAMP domain-containing sensor histidine kinase [Symbiobacteriaceae bacterium]|nr:HAMP domain-containing sensor histidine kinase [Symbiobacteriaceae bacterium]